MCITVYSSLLESLLSIKCSLTRLSSKAAEEGIVLLINRPDAKTRAPTLPLSPSYTGHIAVIGPNGGCGAGPEAGHACGASMNMLGSYTQFAHNPTGAYPVEIPTVHEAVTKAFSAAKVTYSVGANIGDTDNKQLAAAVAAAKAAGVAVVVVGDDLHTRYIRDPCCESLK